jgi:hypothetical protein
MINKQRDLNELWAQQERIIEQNVQFNKTALREIHTLKAQHRMHSLLRLNAVSLGLGICVMSITGYFIFSHLDQIHMMISGIVVLLWSAVICLGAVKQLKLQLHLDYSKPILQVQQQLNQIRLSALFYLRASLMVLPFYFAFLLMFCKLVLGIDLYILGDQQWLVAQAIFSVFMLILAVFLYRQLSPKNIDKPFVRFLMQGTGSQALEALNSVKIIERFETE